MDKPRYRKIGWALRGLTVALTMFGIPNCDTIKRARTWLGQRGVPYMFHDYKRAGIEAETLARWAAEGGWERLLNRAGTTFRKLTDDDRSALAGPEAQAAALRIMRDNPSVIRRPVVEGDGLLLVGFQPEAWEAKFPA